MVAKRKTVSKLASNLKVTKAHLKDDVEEEETEGQIVAVQEEKETTEKELVATRTKELQSMAAGDLKELLLSNGLEKGTKENMIKTLLKHEAKARVAAREQKAKIRAVVITKKQELEGLSTQELSKLSDKMGVKGLRSKEERVQRLLVQWQENDGVDKALAEIAQGERKQELDAFDTAKLQKLCAKMAVDPYVKEVMVERISKREHERGLYSRPVLPQEQAQVQEEKKGDMVDALLANEAQRKKEREIKSHQEDVAAQKRKDLKSLSIDDLKKRLGKKGLEASGKKEDMVEALFVAAMQEEALNERRSELKAKSQQELKEVTSRNGLETGSKEQMVKALLAYEAKLREELRAFDAKVNEVAEKRKEELEKQTNAALKEMCAAKGLALGGDKDDKIERIVEEAQKDGDLDKLVCRELREKRKAELMVMEKPAVVKLCEKFGVEPVVKEVMVERIMMHENETDDAIAMNDSEPAAKRARSSKK